MRSLCYREKIATDFGKFYLNVDAMPDGKVVRVQFAQPQKLKNTEVGRLLVSIEDSINGLIKEARP